MTDSKIILAIDDSTAVHAFIERCFKGTTFKVIHALGSDDGLRKFNDNKNQVALVLLDWEMPGRTGPETLPLLKEIDAHVPIVMVTTKNSPDDIAQMFNAGAAEYIMKPFTPEILVDKVSQLLGLGA